MRVDYTDKYYAGGRMPGGFLKREGKPSEAEVIRSRLIDRSIRPTFVDHFNQEVQITCQSFSLDPMIETDVLALLSSSASLALTGLPLKTRVAGVRVGLIDKKFIINPTKDEIEQSSIDLFITGSKDNVVMVEAIASQVDEKTILDAIEFGQKNIKIIIDEIEKFAKKVNVKPVEIPEPTITKDVDLKKFDKKIQSALQSRKKLIEIQL